jgi:hypothetical protein
MSTIDIPILDGSGQIPGALFGKGTAGGVAALDADGDVINAAGSKILGGGGTGAVDSVNGQTGTVTLSAADVGAATAAQGALADTAVQPEALDVKVDKATTATPQTGAGYWLHLILDAFADGAMDEPMMVEGLRDAVARRAFWLNENGSPRGASVESEPALKLFGPDADDAYAGALFQIFKRYSSQTHIFGVHADGRFRIGAGQTPASPGTVVLAATDPVPTGLPAGTVIVRKPA